MPSSTKADIPGPTEIVPSSIPTTRAKKSIGTIVGGIIGGFIALFTLVTIILVGYPRLRRLHTAAEGAEHNQHPSVWSTIRESTSLHYNSQHIDPFTPLFPSAGVLNTTSIFYCVLLSIKFYTQSIAALQSRAAVDYHFHQRTIALIFSQMTRISWRKD